MKKLTLFVVWFLITFSALAQTGTMLPSPVPPIPPDVALEKYKKVQLYIRFENTDTRTDACWGTGEHIVPFYTWSPVLGFNTDSNRLGHCQLTVVVIDPDDTLGAWRLQMSNYFTGNADPDGGAPGQQCPTAGTQLAPIVRTADDARKIPMQFDFRPAEGAGGCALAFKLLGSGPLFSINYVGNGDWGQCGGKPPVPPYSAGVQTIGVGRRDSVTIAVDTDNRPGGCLLQMQMSPPGISPQKGASM